MREAKRVLLAIAMVEGLNNIIIEGNSLIVVSVFHNLDLLLDWQLEHLIFKTGRLLDLILV